VSGGPSGHGATAGARQDGGGSTGGSNGGAPDTGATGGDGAALNATGGSAGEASTLGGSSGFAASAGKQSTAGFGADAGRNGSAGAPERDDHTPAAFVPACLQPKPTPAGLETPTEIKVGATWLRPSERDCSWTVGEPLALPLDAGDGRELLFQFDLNGDHVDDLIFGDHAVGTRTASGTSLVVLESKLTDGELSYERSPCDGPWDISYRSFFARDLDRDGQPDFVIGRMNGITALLNRGDERPEVLHYDWPPGETVDAWASILDVAVGDFDADGRDDIAVGYDRATGADVLTMETGVLLFRDRSARGTYGPPEQIAGAIIDLTLNASLLAVLPAGLLAVVPSTAGASALISLYLVPEQATGLRYENGSSTNFAAASVPVSPPIFARGAEFAGGPTLMIGSSEVIAIIQPSFPYEHVAGVPLAYRHTSDHEMGGGTRVRSVFLLDLDGDGDDDLVERGTDGSLDGWGLWIHNRTSQAQFDAAALIQDAHESAPFNESPFVRAGGMLGRLFVNDRSKETATVWPLACSGN